MLVLMCTVSLLSMSSLLLLISTLTSSLMSFASSPEMLLPPLDSSKLRSSGDPSSGPGSAPRPRDFGFFCFLLQKKSTDVRKT